MSLYWAFEVASLVSSLIGGILRTRVSTPKSPFALISYQENMIQGQLNLAILLGQLDTGSPLSAFFMLIMMLVVHSPIHHQLIAIVAEWKDSDGPVISIWDFGPYVLAELVHIWIRILVIGYDMGYRRRVSAGLLSLPTARSEPITKVASLVKSLT